MAETTTQTRYERVQEILNQAAGESTADYSGYPRFWELPLDRFLAVQIFGVRMIAPAEEVHRHPCKSGTCPARVPVILQRYAVVISSSHTRGTAHGYRKATARGLVGFHALEARFGEAVEQV